MATQAATQINYNQGLLSWNGFPVEHYRIAAGAAVGDTAVITPNRFSLVKGVFGPVTSNLTTSDTAVTAVTVTLAAVTGSAITVTIGAVDVWIIGFQRN